jgi:hypothetical protein
MKKRCFALLTHPIVMWNVRILLVVHIILNILATQTFVRENNLDRPSFGFVLIGRNVIVLLLVFWPKGGNRPS